MMTVTVDLADLFCTWTHVGVGRGEHAIFGSVKCHVMVIARSKCLKFSWGNNLLLSDLTPGPIRLITTAANSGLHSTRYIPRFTISFCHQELFVLKLKLSG